jgi:hypothetical protein
MRKLTDSLNCSFRYTLKPAWHQADTEFYWFFKNFSTYKAYGSEQRFFFMFRSPSVNNEISSSLEKTQRIITDFI